MFKNNKAQGLSLNTIIIASLVLIVLVVLILVFSGRMGIFGQDLDDQTRLKECVSDDDYIREVVQELPCESGSYSVGPWDNVGPGESCCVERQ